MESTQDEDIDLASESLAEQLTLMMLVIGEHPAAGHARVPKHHSLNLNTFKCDDSKVEARVDLDALRVG
ncbi:hypothetical protein PTI98_010901 [Pleurotus ostreatus]|nr:hypothetical protein PTI98_010901 [Pleurotus ostreatus]